MRRPGWMRARLVIFAPSVLIKLSAMPNPSAAAASTIKETPPMTPIFQVSVGDQDITALVHKCLVSLKIHDSVERASCSLELTLDNRDGAVKVPSFGANLDRK